jgi:molecular chaperone GrpE
MTKATKKEERSSETKEDQKGKPFTVRDRRFWSLKEKGDDSTVREEKRKRTSPYPSYVEELMGKIEEKEGHIVSITSSYRRMKEEMEDARKRLNRDFEKRLGQAKGELFADFLEILDNLDRAVEAARSQSNPNEFAEGLEIIRRQLQQKMADHGLERMSLLGTEFTPDIAEVVAVTETGDRLENNIVLEELLVGYKLKDRVIRPARVRIGKAAAQKGENKKT